MTGGMKKVEIYTPKRVHFILSNYLILKMKKVAFSRKFFFLVSKIKIGSTAFR